MQHYIRSITQDLLNKITDEQMHYTPADLQEAGFPPFLVDRISLEIQRNLADSVSLPDSDWADMQADHVQDAWDNFLVAIRAETRIPASYLRSVIENAVEDILELLAEPERTIQETLFRQEKMASILELQVRRQWIVTNGHLADAVLRYMNRKGLTEISREKAANIIRQIDLHLASGYTPLKWGQALDVWFKLMGQAIPSAMLTRYFADKGLSDIAKRFDQTDEVMNRSRLIEYLSMPDLNWGTADEDDLPGFTPVQAPEKKAPSANDDFDESTSSIASLYSHQQDDENAVGEDEITKDQEDSTEDDNLDESTSTIASLYSHQQDDEDAVGEDEITEDQEDSTEDDDLNESTSSIASLYSHQQDDEDAAWEDEPTEKNDDVIENFGSGSMRNKKANTNPDFEVGKNFDTDKSEEDNPLWNIPGDFESEQDEKDSLLNQFLSEVDATNEKDEPEPFDYGFNAEKDENDEEVDEASSELTNDHPYGFEIDPEENEIDQKPVTEDDSDETANDEVIPIWKRFLAADEIDETTETNDDSSAPNEETTQTNQYAFATPGARLSEDASMMLSYLNQNKQLLIDELFGGDNQFFYDSLNELAGFDTWSQAGRHLTREIFIPNDIDMYSGEAVLFVDLLQQYYEENK